LHNLGFTLHRRIQRLPTARLFAFVPLFKMVIYWRATIRGLAGANPGI